MRSKRVAVLRRLPSTVAVLTLAAAVVALAVPAIIVVASNTARTSRTVADPAAACPPSSVRAIVGGKRVCLKPGQRCRRRNESTYRRYGFSCRAGRLVRRNAPKPPLPPGASVQATIALGERLDPIWLAATDEAVWVRSESGLMRIDPATNTIAARVTTPPVDFGYVAVGEGAVWQTNFGMNALLRVDPATNQVVTTIPLGEDAAPEGVGVTPGAVWVALHHQGTVARIDPATNQVVARIQVGPAGRDGPLKLAARVSGVWVDVPNTNSVVRIDPETNAVTGTVSVSGIPVLDGPAVYVVAGAMLDRIDPTTNRILATTQLPAAAADGAAGLASVWVTTSIGLVRIDQATNKVVGKLGGVQKGEVAVGAGSVWVAEYRTGRLLRIAPR